MKIQVNCECIEIRPIHGSGQAKLVLDPTQTHLPASGGGRRNPKSTTRISQLSILGKGERRLVRSIVGIFFFFFFKRSSKFAKNVIEIWKKSSESRKICWNLEKGARIYIFFPLESALFH